MVQGRTFGDFVIKERIGAGGGGEVYRAEQVTLGREAVIKVMSISADADGSGASERFLREARLASQLDHPFAAHVYGFGTEPDGALWIAMELVRGTPLDAIIKAQGPMPLPRFVPFFERLCEVLHAAPKSGPFPRVGNRTCFSHVSAFRPPSFFSWLLALHAPAASLR